MKLSLLLSLALTGCSAASGPSTPLETSDGATEARDDQADAGHDADADAQPETGPRAALCCNLNTGPSVACGMVFYCWNQSGDLTGAGNCADAGCVPGWGCNQSGIVPSGPGGVVGDCE